MNRFLPLLNFFLFLNCCFLVSAPHAADLPSQAITLSFDLRNNLVFGKSTVSLPAGTQLRLTGNGLKNFKIYKISENGKKPVPFTSPHTVSLPEKAHNQIFALSWQVITKTNKTGSANLVSTDGITLTGRWHPLPDRKILFSLKADLPRGFSGITEADNLRMQHIRGRHILTASAPQPLYSINFAAGPYIIRSTKIGSTSLYTYFFAEDAHLAASYLAKAKQYIRHFEQLIGPFPYARYSIVENRLPSGYGMPGYTLLGQSVIRLPFIKDTSLGHEILHSWFGNSLQTDNSGNWSEGLTTYLADQSFAQKRNKGKEYRKNQLIRYQSRVHEDNLFTLTDFGQSGDSRPMAEKMRAIGYDKGSMFFHMLRREIGDKTFFRALRTLYQKNKNKSIGWPDLETTFSREAGKDLSRFFGQWLLRNDIPNIALHDAVLEHIEGREVVSFTVTQKNKTPYLLKLPVVITTLTGTSRQTIAIKSQNQKVSLSVDSLPTAITLDPDYDLMRTLTAEELPPVWIRFLTAEQKTVVLPDKDKLERYLPLMAELERQGCKLIAGKQLKNSDLNSGSFLFLGDTRHTRGLFGPVTHSAKGFTLDVRNNPLARGQVMVLVYSESTEETSSVIHRINHYGTYSFLYFLKGQIQEKQITAAQDGIQSDLLPLPQGIPVREVQSFGDIIDSLGQSRVVYVGETHTDPGAHILQLQVIQALYTKNPELMIGMEMFPRSAQQALDEYISGKITDEREFLLQSKYFDVWGFDYRLYRGILDFARKHHIPVKGLNLDKDIVSTVFKKGSTDSLNDRQWQQVAAERDLTLPGYRERLEATHSMHARSPHGANFSGFLQAQAMWDETMAESIVLALQENPQKKMVVLAGTGHVYKDSAIPARVARRQQVSQSVLIANNGLDTGKKLGEHADFLMFTENVPLSPAGKIGVVLQETEKKDDTPASVRIVQINPAGQADDAGLRTNDVISAVDDFPVATIGALKAGLMGKKPGDTVKLSIQRGTKSLTINVKLSNMDMAAMALPPGHPRK